MSRIYQQIIYGRQRFLLMALLLFFMAFYAPKAVEASTPLCAEVKIVIEQKLSFERQAFDAKMIISNGLHDADVKDVNIELLFMDKNEQPVTGTTDPNAVGAKFFYRTDSLKGIDSIEGVGQVNANSAAEIHWLIIPSAGAAANEGSLYYVGAKVTYTLNGVETTVDVTPDYIVVKPQPKLTLDYFLPIDVYADDAFTDEIEPPVPFTLGVRIKNTGLGAAMKTAIESAQPKIVENKLNLLIDFKILGGYVSDEPAGQSLLLDFGNIDAQSSKVGRWNMITTLSGQFVEFNAYYSHADELGGAVTSLLEEVNTHTLVHDVKVDLPGRDNIRDFLAKDGDVLRVYESDSIDTVVTNQSKTAQLQLLSDSAKLTYQAVPGFTYAQMSDPYQESRVPAKAVRSDGKVLPPENIWLSKTRDESGENWLYYINIFDENTTGIYEVFFAQNPFASISGLVFDDANGNGILEEGESGVGVAKITLTGLSNNGDSIVTTAYTDILGQFKFKQIQPGQYALEVATSEGMIDIAAIAGDAGGVVVGNKISGIDLGAGITAQGYQFAKQWSTVIPPNVKADLSMTMTASTLTPAIGDSVNFVYKVDNTGPDQAKQIKAAITWPEGLTAITCQGAEYIDALWMVGLLNAGTSKELNCTALALDLSVERTVNAVVASQTFDPETNNNEASVTLQAVVSPSQADISINIEASTLTPNTGEQVTFIYTAHNAGPDLAKDVQTTINWPNGLTDVICQATGGDQYSNGFWKIDQLLAGTSKQLNCSAKVLAVNGTMNIAAAITSQTSDDNQTNNEQSIILTLRTGQAKLSGLVYEDVNENGIQNAEEPGLQSVTVMLRGKNASGEFVQLTTQTNEKGEFTFAGLDAATYTLSVADVELMRNGAVIVGSAFGYATDGAVNSITLSENTNAQGYVFAKCKIKLSSIAGQVLYTPTGLPQTGLGGLEVYLTGVVNGETYKATVATNANGQFVFENLFQGVYKITLQYRAGTTIQSAQPGTSGGYVPIPYTEVSNISLKENVQATNYRFILRQVPAGTSSISGSVYLDTNKNGVFDSEEKALSGRRVTLLGGQISLAVYSDENGAFSFTNLPGNIRYLLGVDYNGRPFEGSLTAGTAGGITQSGVNNMPYINILLPNNVNATGYLFGKYVLPNSASISGVVYEDSNANGVQDADENGLGGVQVKLTGSLLGLPYAGATTQTGIDGRFAFENLEAGTYALTVSAVESMTDTVTSIGNAGGVAAEGRVTSIKVDSGVNAQSYMFGKRILQKNADLSVTQIASTRKPSIGETITVDYTIKNEGPDAAVNTKLSMTWPEGVTDVRCYDYKAGRMITNLWEVGIMLAGESKGLSCTAKVIQLSQDQTIVAHVASQALDSVEDNNRAMLTLKAIDVRASSISGKVYFDENGNGIIDQNEAGITSVAVTLSGQKTNGEKVWQAHDTESSGAFTFSRLEPGLYTLNVSSRAQMLDGASKPGNAGGVALQGAIKEIHLTEGVNVSGYNFAKLMNAEPQKSAVQMMGYLKNKPSIGSRVEVFFRVDNFTCSPMKDVKVDITWPDGLSNIQCINEQGIPVQGQWEIGDMDCDTWRTYADLTCSANVLDLTDKQVVHASTSGGSANLVQGHSSVDIPLWDINAQSFQSLTGTVFNDKNGSGSFDAMDEPLEHVAVMLTGVDENNQSVSLTTYTDERGVFRLLGLPKGIYALEIGEVQGMINGAVLVGYPFGTVGSGKVTEIKLFGNTRLGTPYWFAKREASDVSTDVSVMAFSADMNGNLGENYFQTSVGDMIYTYFMLENLGKDIAENVQANITWTSGLSDVACYEIDGSGVLVGGELFIENPLLPGFAVHTVNNGVWQVGTIYPKLPWPQEFYEFPIAFCVGNVSNLTGEQSITVHVTSETPESEMTNNTSVMTFGSH